MGGAITVLVVTDVVDRAGGATACECDEPDEAVISATTVPARMHTAAAIAVGNHHRGQWDTDPHGSFNLVLALVVLETAAIALLGVLVAGLLRSHAEILRQLHHLGINLDPDRVDAPGPTAARRVPPQLVGETPDGDAVAIGLARRGDRTLLLFLSSGCRTCAPLWDGLADHAAYMPGTRLVVVTRDATEESPGALQVGGAELVMSSEAWDAFHVPGSPFAVLVEDGAIAGRGVAHSWEQLASLIEGHRRDVDRDLAAAGIHPGDASLYPSH